MPSRMIRCSVLALFGIGLTGALFADDTERYSRVYALMLEDLEPAAEIIWDSAGWIITEDGEEELWPTTDDGWAAVADGAALVAEISRKLATPDYAGEVADWIEISRGLEIAAHQARFAAEAQDKDALFNAGGHLYRLCVACHERYMVDRVE